MAPIPAAGDGARVAGPLDPSGAPGSRARRPGTGRAWLAPVVTAGVTAAATTVLALRSPHAPGSYGICPSLALFGLYCPLCGGLRATHDLARLDLAGALEMNVMVVVAVPLVGVLWLWWLASSLDPADPLDQEGRPGRRRVPPVRLPATTGWVLLAVVIVYGVLRNLPGLVGLTPGGG